MSERNPKLCTKEELAELFGVSPRTMRDWLEGLPADIPGKSGRGNAALWTLPRLVTHRYMHGETERLDLEQQRARQAKESADKLELENAVKRGEFAPVHIFEEALFGYTRQATAMLDSLGPNIRRLLPHLSESDHTRIHNHLATERERIAARLESGLDAPEPYSEEGSEPVETTAEAVSV